MDLLRIFVICFCSSVYYVEANHRQGQSFSSNQRSISNIAPSRSVHTFSSRRHQSSGTRQRTRTLPHNRASGQFLRTLNGRLRLRPTSTTRSSGVRFGRVINSGFSSRGSASRAVNSRMHTQQRHSSSPQSSGNKMISIPKDLLIDLLQNARRLNRNLNSRRMEQQLTQPVTEPSVILSVSANNLANSISSNVGSQLQNLLHWNQAQNVIEKTIPHRIPSIPSSIAFQPIIEEPFGNEPQYVLMPSMSPPVIFSPPHPAPTYRPTQFDLALQAHILDELGLENLIKDMPDASEAQQPKPEKKPKKSKKTKIVINTKKNKRVQNNPQNGQNNHQTSGISHLIAAGDLVATTMKPIRILLNNHIQSAAQTQAVTTPSPGPISVHENQKLIITPSGNYTIQKVPLNNSGFQIA